MLYYVAAQRCIYDSYTHYDKTARNFLAAIYLAANVVWLN
jgi:hypothetical protein